MPTVDVVDFQNAKVGTIDLPPHVFGCEPRVELVHEAVVMQRACERQGTASTRRRGEVSGSGKKPWRQKHTGRARAGSLRSPLWRHGGTVFGPKPRSYAYSMPRRKYRAALQSALSAKVAEGRLVVLADSAPGMPKTKWLAGVLDRLRNGQHALIVAGEERIEFLRAAQNLPDVTVVTVEGLNVYDVVRAGVVVLLQGEVAHIQEVWS
ncbi:MAG: 50S ribosomal protein L4 [Nitrospira sp.]|nr:50S ribosomal protein L4 [Nitrospira sp.]MCP9465343.1 50S ribosomal protein L4 [Nitrospira sp.]